MFTRRDPMRILSVILAMLAAGVGSTLAEEETPLLVGGHAHGTENIRALAELGLGNFVWIPKPSYSMGNTPWDKAPSGNSRILADVDECLKHGLYFAISQRRGLGQAWRPGGGEYGGDCWGDDVLIDAATIREIARRAGPRLAGLHAEELDIDFLQNGRRLSSRARVPHLYDFTDRAGGRRTLEAELRRIGDKYHAYAPGIKYWPNMSVLHHCGFRAGGDLVFAELLESLPNTEWQLACLRGGGHQFAKDWGIWVSPWYGGEVPCEDKSLWSARQAKVGGGHAASAFKRCLYLSYAAGARVLSMQETEPLFARKDSANPHSGYRLAAWGTELRSFWDYVRTHPERVQPLPGVALLVDKNQGWAPGNLHGGWLDLETIWAKLRVEPGDQMLSGYLDSLLPGSGRKSGAAAWEKGKTYPGYFAATPSGPFDIVTTDIPAGRLAAYACVVAVGEINMTEGLMKTLRAYVQGGGTLHLNAYQMRLHEDFIQEPDLVGATIGLSKIESPWAGGTITGRRIYPSNRICPRVILPGVKRSTYEEPWYVMQDVQPSPGAEILAASADKDGQPVLLRNRFGRGWLYLSTPEFCTDGYQDRSRVLGFFADLLKGLAECQTAAVSAPSGDEPAPDISWMVSQRGRDRLIFVAANHGKQQRVLDVVWRRAVTDGEVEAGGGKLVSTVARAGRLNHRVSIPAEDVVVLGVKMR
jgi:hypothetical protein